MSYTEKDVVTMAHGSGGQAMQQLIEQLFLRAFSIFCSKTALGYVILFL